MSYIEQIRSAFKYLSEIIQIPRNYKVLDIGSGNNPFARANVLCERSVEDDLERVGKIVIDRPLVVGDITKLPFQDKAFDVIVCCHLLEHLEKPEEGLEEIMRVARTGIIEVPSEYFEKINSHNFHYWYITYEDKVLNFKPKERPIFDAFLTNIFHEKIWLKDKHFMKFYNSNRYKYFNIRFKWKEKIAYRIHRNLGESIISSEAFSKAKTIIKDSVIYKNKLDYQYSKGGKSIEIFPKLKIYIKKILRFFLVKPVDVYKIIACPLCKKVLETDKANDILICKNCNLEYPIVNNIPILLVDKSKQHLVE